MAKNEVFIEHPNAHHATEEQLKKAAKKEGVSAEHLKLVSSESSVGSKYRVVKTAQKPVEDKVKPGQVVAPPEVPADDKA